LDAKSSTATNMLLFNPFPWEFC